MKVLKISELNNIIKKHMESFSELKYICVEGEASNITYQSRHMYFTLKDRDANIKCAGFNYTFNDIPRNLKEGDKVKVYGKINVYQVNASLQILCNRIEKNDDIGDLYKRREELINLYKSKGYFDTNIKKKLPKYPKKIGVVTAHTGAAIHDIVTTAHKRNPNVDIYVYSAKVQGKGSEKEIAEGIKYFNESDLNIDCIIIGRGGGSIEDLWAFNEVEVIEAVYESKLPIISAVGHEVDVLISDFVADARAATPTGAAEILIPVKSEIIDKLNIVREKVNRVLNEKLKTAKLNLDLLKDSYCFKNFESIQIIDRYNYINNIKTQLRKDLILKLSLKNKKKEINNIKNNLNNIVQNILYKKEMEIKNIKANISKYDNKDILERGFSITLKDGKVIKNQIISKNDIIETIYAGNRTIKSEVK